LLKALVVHGLNEEGFAAQRKSLLDVSRLAKLDVVADDLVALRKDEEIVAELVRPLQLLWKPHAEDGEIKGKTLAAVASALQVRLAAGRWCLAFGAGLQLILELEEQPHALVRDEEQVEDLRLA